MIIDYILIFGILIIYLRNKYSRLDEIILLSIAVIFCLWLDFNYVNYITLDIKKKLIVIKSKNFIKQILGSKQYDFSEINSFYIESKKDPKSFIRYVLYLNLKNDEKIVITDFYNYEQAVEIAKYLTLELTAAGL